MGNAVLHTTARKYARIFRRKPAHKRTVLRGSFYVKEFDVKKPEDYDFQVITPHMQIKERNSAYSFLSLN